MIRKILIFMLLLQLCKAYDWKKTHHGKCYQDAKTIDITNITTFKKSCQESGESNGLLLSNPLICIPGWCKSIIKYRPTKKERNLIDISMSKIEVIDIDVNTLTISMRQLITWKDSRFQLFTDSTEQTTTEDLEMFHLSEDEFNGIWSPQIAIGTNKLSQTEQNLKCGMGKRVYENWMRVEVRKQIDLIAKVKCKYLTSFPFDKHLCTFEFVDQQNESKINKVTVNLPNKDSNTKVIDDYMITSIEGYNNSAQFGINIEVERTMEGTTNVLLNYHMICAILVIVASINFLIDPKVVPGRAGMLVTLFLVLTTFFSDAQDEAKGFNALTIYIMTCMIFIACAMLYYGLILFNLRKILKIEDASKGSKENDIQRTNSIIRWDIFMLIIFVSIFFLFNICYFTKYLSIQK